MRPRRRPRPTRVEPGSFVWHDLLTRDVAGAKRFYGELLGWRFEDTKRGDRPYVIARSGATPSRASWTSAASPTPARSGLVSWRSPTSMRPSRSFNLVAARCSSSHAICRSHEPRSSPIRRVHRSASRNCDVTFPIPPSRRRATSSGRSTSRATRGRPSTSTKGRRVYPGDLRSRLGVEYHVLKKARGGAGLFQLPANVTDVQPNWLPYVLVDDAASLAARVTSLGGRVVVPAAPERRNSSLIVVADPAGAVLALQKYPF